MSPFRKPLIRLLRKRLLDAQDELDAMTDPERHSQRTLELEMRAEQTRDELRGLEC